MARSTDWRLSPSIVISVLALLVAASGRATALPRSNSVDHDDLGGHVVHGSDIHDGAIGSAKISVDSLLSRHILDGGIRTQDLAPGIEGLAVAGARISEEGVVESWFNRLGGEPTVERIGIGHLRITIPRGARGLPQELPIVTAFVESDVPALVTYQLRSDGSFDLFTWDAAGRPYGRGIDIATIDGELGP